MSPISNPSKFATHPYPLIETPIHTQNLTKPYDQYFHAASIMAISHNVLIRGLNSIVLQAPHVPTQHYADFIAYALCWAEVLDGHHRIEEESLFPVIERITGDVGVMEGCIEEHHSFLPGLVAYKTYLKSLTTSPQSLSPAHLLSLITSFASPLLSHMASEIPSLLALSHHGDKLPLLQLMEKESAKSPMHLSITGGTPFFFRHLDVEFEGGRWSGWPEMPGLVWWVLMRTFGRWRGGVWRFAACDERGRLRELEFLGGGETGREM